MVLQEATAHSEEPFADGDAQVYDRFYQNDAQIDPEPPWLIDPARFSKRWTMFGRRAINQRETELQYRNLAEISKMIHRPLSNDEKEALTHHITASASRITSHIPIGILGGAARATMTADKYKFPFRKADPSFDPNKLWFLRDATARLAWHTLRYTAYCTAGLMLAGPVLAFLGARMQYKGVSQDSRLQQFNHDLIKSRAERVNSARSAAMPMTNHASAKPRVAATTVADDDMSPTSDFTVPNFEPMTESGVAGVASEHDAKQSIGRPSTSPMQPSARSSRSQTSSAATNAWDIVRQNAKSGQNINPPTATSKARGSGAAGDRANNIGDQEQAQKIFDERVERERNGKDFSANSGRL